MTVTTPAVTPKRGRKLAELILAESGWAGLEPGFRLPTERRLAADLGVTRSGIRLALAALEADGLISREVGRGTFLRDAAASALAAARRGEAGAGRAAGGLRRQCSRRRFRAGPRRTCLRPRTSPRPT